MMKELRENEGRNLLIFVGIIAALAGLVIFTK